MGKKKEPHMTREYWVAQAAKEQKQLDKAVAKLIETPEFKAVKKWSTRLSMSELCAGIKRKQKRAKVL